MTWQLSTYERNGTSGLAVLRADGSLAGPPELKRWPTMMELLAGWQQAEGVLRGLEVSGAPLVEHDSLLAPVRWPRKVMCAGVNYRRHMREMGGEIPAGGWRPFFFLKAPTTTVIGPGDPIVIRSPEQARYDWEAEDGHRYYTKEAHVADLAGEAIDKLVEFWPDMPMEGEVEIIGLGGAIGDVPEDATAFSNRGYLLWLNFAMRWDDPACDASTWNGPGPSSATWRPGSARAFTSTCSISTRWTGWSRPSAAWRSMPGSAGSRPSTTPATSSAPTTTSYPQAP